MLLKYNATVLTVFGRETYTFQGLFFWAKMTNNVFFRYTGEWQMKSVSMQNIAMKQGRSQEECIGNVMK